MEQRPGGDKDCQKIIFLWKMLYHSARYLVHDFQNLRDLSTDRKSITKIQYAGGPIYCLELLFFKLAFLISYLRIGGFVATYRIVLFVAISVIVVNQIVCAFIISLSCNPVSQYSEEATATIF